jgi:exportin-2 (importin alpha re-exporter)
VAVQQSVDTMQPGLFLMILQQVWAPSIASVDGQDEEKLVAVATTRCLTEMPALQQAQPAYEALKQALLTQLQGGGENALALTADEEGDGQEEFGGYSAAYAKLANASKAEQPVLPEIPDVKAYVQSALAGR